MDEERVHVKVLNGYPDGKRRVERAKGRRKDIVETNLKSLRINDWRPRAIGFIGEACYSMPKPKSVIIA